MVTSIGKIEIKNLLDTISTKTVEELILHAITHAIIDGFLDFPRTHQLTLYDPSGGDL